MAFDSDQLSSTFCAALVLKRDVSRTTRMSLDTYYPAPVVHFEPIRSPQTCVRIRVSHAQFQEAVFAHLENRGIFMLTIRCNIPQ